MKFDNIKIIIAILLSALLSYGCYAICDYSSVAVVLTIVSFIIFSTLSILSFGVQPKEERNSMTLTALSTVSFFVALLINFGFSFFDFNIPLYIITNGILVLLYLLIYTSVYKTHQ